MIVDLDTLRAWAEYERKNRTANDEYERIRDTIDYRYGDAPSRTAA